MHYGLNERQKKILSSYLPTDILDSLSKGGSSLTYITHSCVSEILDYLFDGCWSFEVIERWTQESISAVDKYKSTKDENGNLIPINQPPVATVLVRLTYPLYPQPDYEGEVVSGDPIFIKKDGIGTDTFMGKADQQENMFKSATSDALKKAASLIGVGRDLYDKNGKLDSVREWIGSSISDMAWTPHDYLEHGETLSKIAAVHEAIGVKEGDDSYMKLLTEFYEMNHMSTNFNVTITPGIAESYLEYLIAKVGD